MPKIGIGVLNIIQDGSTRKFNFTPPWRGETQLSPPIIADFLTEKRLVFASIAG